MTLPSVESLPAAKLPVLLPKPAPPVDPLPNGAAWLYGAVSLWLPKRKSSDEELELESDLEKDDRLFPGSVVSGCVVGGWGC